MLRRSSSRNGASTSAKTALIVRSAPDRNPKLEPAGTTHRVLEDDECARAGGRVPMAEPAPRQSCYERGDHWSLKG